MLRTRYRTLSFVVIVGLTLLPVSDAFALYRQLSTKLSGPPIGGLMPQGDAKVDQSNLPQQPGKLEVKVKDVNLPDGTTLTVVMTDCGGTVGQFTLSQKQGQVTITFPNLCGIGRTSSIFLRNGAQTVLSGGAPWQV